MAHFAKYNTMNEVTEVIVINNDVIENLPFPESETVGISFCKSLYGEDTDWVQTSYNQSFRYNYAGIGYTFDSSIGEYGAFVPPSPYKSWVLNESTCIWQAPVSYPDDGKDYYWSESTVSWKLVVN